MTLQEYTSIVLVYARRAMCARVSVFLLMFTMLSVCTIAIEANDDLSIFDETPSSGYDAEADLEAVKRERLVRKRTQVRAQKTKHETEIVSRCSCYVKRVTLTGFCLKLNTDDWSDERKKRYEEALERTEEICSKWYTNRGTSSGQFVEQLNQLDHEIEAARAEEERAVAAEKARRAAERRERQRAKVAREQEAREKARQQQQANRDAARAACEAGIANGGYPCVCEGFDDLRQWDATGCSD